MISMPWEDVAKAAALILAAGMCFFLFTMGMGLALEAVARNGPALRAFLLIPDGPPTCPFCEFDTHRLDAMPIDADGRPTPPPGARWVCTECDPPVYFAAMPGGGAKPPGDPHPLA